MLSMLGLGALKQRQHIGSSFPFPSADSHAPPVHAEAAPSPSPVCGPKSPCHQSWASTLELRRTLLSRVLSSTTIGAWHHSHRPRLSPCAKLLAGVGMASLQNSQVAVAHNLDSCLQSVRLCPVLLASLQRRCSSLDGFRLLGVGQLPTTKKKLAAGPQCDLRRLYTKCHSTFPPSLSFLDFAGSSSMVGPAGPAADDMTEQKSRGSTCVVRAREGTHAHSHAPRYPRHGGPRRGGRPTRPRRAVRQRRWTGGHPPGSNAQGFWTRFCSARRRRAPAASCTRRGAPDGGYAGFARRRQET